ncbi:MAG: zinc ribbon domain-containing protein, partial [Anaerolineales bacterium]|nr:zinc ribbon domain-containing protein [Anaerolineales bacterium]
MSHQVPCPNCHSLNTLGSKFCNNCGQRLPPSTKILCPNCQTPNPRDRFYCDNCGKRLVEESLPKEEQKPEKGSPQKFFLPERDVQDLSDMEPGSIPDWMKTGEMPLSSMDEEEGDLPSIEELAPLRKTTDELPTWLVDNVYSSAPPFEPPKEITTDNFLELLRATEDELDLPDEMAQAASQAELPDWLSDIVPGATGKLTDKSPQPAAQEQEEDDADDWLTQLGPAHTDLLEKDAQTVDSWEVDEEESNWLEELGPIQTSLLDDDDDDDRPVSGILSTSEFADQVLAGDKLPDWLQELGPAQTGQLTEEKPPHKPPAADEPPVSGIFESDEFAAQVRQALGTEDIPDWLKELGPAQTKPLEETADSEPHDEIREWMTQIGPPTGIPSVAGTPEFDALQHARNAATEDEDDDIYDWLKEPAD